MSVLLFNVYVVEKHTNEAVKIIGECIPLRIAEKTELHCLLNLDKNMFYTDTVEVLSVQDMKYNHNLHYIKTQHA